MRLKLIGMISLFSLLSACSTTENEQANQIRIKPPTSTVKQPQNAAEFYAKARIKRGVNKIQLLYQARDLAITEKNWDLLITIGDDLNQLNNTDHVQNNLYIARANLELGKYSFAIRTLENLNTKLTSPNHYFLHQYIYGRVYASQFLPNQAVPYLVRASETSASHSFNDEELNVLLWQQLNQLSADQLETLKTGSTIQQGWINLALYSQLYIGDPVSLHSAMTNWQRRYPAHPASFALPNKVQDLMAVAPYKDEKVAVILPSSKSNNKAIADAVKNGIIAASNFTPNRQIHFIDANLPPEQISIELTEFNPDFVIGPLLKGNIEKLQQANTLENYATLYLNSPDTPLTNVDHYTFALKTEHEVTNAIYHFVNQGYTKPLIMAPGNRNGKRLVEHFRQTWSQYVASEPEVGFYANRKEMQKQVQSLLEVDQSKARIKQVEAIFKTKVESETRSRRDIDVIYLIGNPVQTRLLKPSFDVNISTFSARIPLFATSRSHDVNTDNTDKRDLAGLYFSEMPWLLPFQYEGSELRGEFNLLWPEQANLEQQLFAMGYDAMKIVPELKQLHAVPGKLMQGLTGKLSVNQNGDVERELNWAQYQSQSIISHQLDSQRPTPLFIKEEQLKQQAIDAQLSNSGLSSME